MNVDASVKPGENSFSIGMVLRNQYGHFISGKTMRFAGTVTVLEAEEVGILEVLLWSEDLNMQQITVESDALQGVKAVNLQHNNRLEQGHVIEQCKSVLRRRSGFWVVYVRKPANKVAHDMARVPYELNSFILFVGDYCVGYFGLGNESCLYFKK